MPPCRICGSTQFPNRHALITWNGIPSKNGNGRKSSINGKHSKINVDRDDILSPNKFRFLVTDDASDFTDEINDNVEVSVVNNAHKVAERKMEKEKRPQIVTNKYPERNVIIYHTKKTVPGNSSYSNMRSQGTKILILPDSICGRIYISKLNEALKSTHAVKKIYPGATPKELEHYCLKQSFCGVDYM